MAALDGQLAAAYGLLGGEPGDDAGIHFVDRLDRAVVG